MTPFEQTVHHYLTHLYGPRAGEVQRRIGQHLANFRTASTASPPANTAGHDAPTWSEKDQWVICYGDSILDEGTPPLAVLDTFLQRYLGDAISGVHVLPFFPWSSDDGFSVMFRHRRAVVCLGGESTSLRRFHDGLLANFPSVLRMKLAILLPQISHVCSWFLAGQDPFLHPPWSWRTRSLLK